MRIYKCSIFCWCEAVCLFSEKRHIFPYGQLEGFDIFNESFHNFHKEFSYLLMHFSFHWFWWFSYFTLHVLWHINFILFLSYTRLLLSCRFYLSIVQFLSWAFKGTYSVCCTSENWNAIFKTFFCRLQVILCIEIADTYPLKCFCRHWRLAFGLVSLISSKWLRMGFLPLTVSLFTFC